MKRAEDYAGAAVGLVILATFVVIVVTVTRQVDPWLKHGIWTEYSISQMLDELGFAQPVTTWVGIQQIIDAVLGLHASLAMLAIGILASVVMFYVVLWLAQTLQRLFSPLPPRRP